MLIHACKNSIAAQLIEKIRDCESAANINVIYMQFNAKKKVYPAAIRTMLRDEPRDQPFVESVPGKLICTYISGHRLANADRDRRPRRYANLISVVLYKFPFTIRFPFL